MYRLKGSLEAKIDEIKKRNALPGLAEVEEVPEAVSEAVR